MLRRTATLCSICALFLLLCTCCFRNSGMFSEPATVVSSRYFPAAKALPAALQKKLPAELSYYSPKQPARNGIRPAQFSHIIYSNLSLNFLWTGEQHNLPVDGTTYSAMPSAGQTATHNGTELLITSEFSQENLSLLAVVDWDNTDSHDWLVLYSFKSLVQPETSTRLLLIRDVRPNKILTGTVLSASECYGNNCRQYTGSALASFLEYQPRY